MGTIVRYDVDGEWVVQPRAPHEAEREGWHRGIEYGSIFDITNKFPYDDFREWCETTFQRGTYAIFIRNSWFRNEQDAVFCRLKWTKAGNITE